MHKIGEILVEAGYMTPAQVREVMRTQLQQRKAGKAQRFGEIARSARMINTAQLDWALKQQLTGSVSWQFKRLAVPIMAAVMLVGCFTATVAWAKGAFVAPARPEKPWYAHKAPVFSGQQPVTHQPISLANFASMVVLVNFWMPGCPEAEGEIPSLVALQNKYASKGFRVLGMFRHAGEIPDAEAQNVIEQRHINYYNVIATDEIMDQFVQRWGVPQSFLIDRHGEIVHHSFCELDRKEWEDAIEAAL